MSSTATKLQILFLQDHIKRQEAIDYIVTEENKNSKEGHEKPPENAEFLDISSAEKGQNVWAKWQLDQLYYKAVVLDIIKPEAGNIAENNINGKIQCIHLKHIL